MVDDLPVRQMQTQECALQHKQILDMLEGIGKRLDAAILSNATLSDRIADKICGEIRELRTALVGPATSEGKISLKVVMPVIWTLCGTICALVVWFTGVRPFLPSVVQPTLAAPQHVSALEK